MKIPINKKKCFLFIIGSWLMAKLWWTIEMSRLAFFRSVPQKKINRIIYASNTFPLSHWNYEQDRLSIINYDEDNQVFIFYKLPELTKN